MYERADEIGQEIALTRALIDVTKDESFAEALYLHLDVLQYELVNVVDKNIEEQKNVRAAIDELLGSNTYNETDQTDD